MGPTAKTTSGVSSRCSSCDATGDAKKGSNASAPRIVTAHSTDRKDMVADKALVVAMLDETGFSVNAHSVAFSVDGVPHMLGFWHQRRSASSRSACEYAIIGERAVAVVKAEMRAIMSKTSVGQPRVFAFIFRGQDQRGEKNSQFTQL